MNKSEPIKTIRYYMENIKSMENLERMIKQVEKYSPELTQKIINKLTEITNKDYNELSSNSRKVKLLSILTCSLYATLVKSDPLIILIGEKTIKSALIQAATISYECPAIDIEKMEKNINLEESKFDKVINILNAFNIKYNIDEKYNILIPKP